jgi:hypothetical protein
METNANGINTGLIDSFAKPIFVGDKFRVRRHQNICCEHMAICEVRVDPNCRCGYGLFEISTGELIANAEIASDRYEEPIQAVQGLVTLEPPVKLVPENGKLVVRVHGRNNNDVGLRMGTDFEASDIQAVLEFAKEIYKLAFAEGSYVALNKK